MNIYLFCIVAGITLVGWIWFFVEGYPEKTLMDTVTKRENIHTWAGIAQGESLYDLATTEDNINDFFTNKGIFKSEHKTRTLYLISSEQLRKLEQWHTDVRSMVDPQKRRHFTYDRYSNDVYYQLINHIKNS